MRQISHAFYSWLFYFDFYYTNAAGIVKEILQSVFVIVKLIHIEEHTISLHKRYWIFAPILPKENTQFTEHTLTFCDNVSQ